MAKRKVVVDDGKSKKKRNGCCTCLLTVFIVFVVILGAGIGVGWYFGDKYTKQYLDMSLKDCFGVLSDLTHAKEKKIITRGYGDTSPVEFENSLKKQLFLNESAPLNKEILIERLLGKKDGAEVQNGEMLARALKESGADTDTSGGESDNALMSYVSSLFTLENMDLQSLDTYDESAHSEFIMSFSDVQLAAFLSSALKDGLASESVVSDGTLKEINDMLGGGGLAEALTLDQVYFFGTAEDPHMRVTLSVDIRGIANAYIANGTGMKLGFVTKLFLPKRIYVTADVKMSGDGSLELFVNQMDGAKMDRFYKLVNGLMNLNGGETDVRETITNGAGKAVSGIAKAIGDYGDVSEISSGKLKIDLLEALIEVSKLNEGKEDADKLSSPDLIYALKYVATSDFEIAVDKAATWINRYYENGDRGSAPVYKPADRVGDLDERADYEKELMQQLKQKYLISATDESGNERTFKQLMSLFGIGGNDDGKTLVDWIEPDRMGALAARTDDIRIVMTNEILGAVFNSQVENIIDGGGSLASMEPKVYQVRIEKRGEGADAKYFMNAGIAVKPAGFLSGVGGIADMVSGIFGDEMMVRFTMEITLGVGDGYDYAPTTVAINDLTESEMSRFTEIMRKLGVNLSTEEIAGQLETPMRNALNSMKEQIPGLTLDSSAMILPDLFEVTADKMLDGVTYDDGNGAKEIGGAELKAVVDKLYNCPEPDRNITGDDIASGDIATGDEITQKQLGVYVRDIMRSQSGEEGAFYCFANLTRTEIFATGGERIEMTVEVDLKNMFAGNSDGGDMRKFITAENLYVDITVDLSKPPKDLPGGGKAYVTETKINGMNKTERAVFEAIVRKYNGGAAAELDFDGRADDIGGIVYGLLHAYNGTVRDTKIVKNA